MHPQLSCRPLPEPDRAGAPARRVLKSSAFPLNPQDTWSPLWELGIVFFPCLSFCHTCAATAMTQNPHRGRLFTPLTSSAFSLLLFPFVLTRERLCLALLLHGKAMSSVRWGEPHLFPHPQLPCTLGCVCIFHYSWPSDLCKTHRSGLEPAVFSSATPSPLLSQCLCI